MFQARILVESILHSLRDVGSTVLSRTLVGEEPKELPAQAMSLLVFREEPKLLAGTVLSNNGNSFRLTSLPFQLDNDTQFVDSQVGVRTIKLHRIQLYYKYFARRGLLYLYIYIYIYIYIYLYIYIYIYIYLYLYILFIIIIYITIIPLSRSLEVWRAWGLSLWSFPVVQSYLVVTAKRSW